MVEYEQDLYGWSVETAAALRERRLTGVDLDAVAEEILDVGKHERATLTSVLTQVLAHMLKTEFQPEKQSRSWELSILEHRVQARQILANNPSLRPLVGAIVGDAYEVARLRAARQTGKELNVFSVNVHGWSSRSFRRLRRKGKRQRLVD
jgi:hypothetical protein